MWMSADWFGDAKVWHRRALTLSLDPAREILRQDRATATAPQVANQRAMAEAVLLA